MFTCEAAIVLVFVSLFICRFYPLLNLQAHLKSRISNNGGAN